MQNKLIRQLAVFTLLSAISIALYLCTALTLKVLLAALVREVMRRILTKKLKPYMVNPLPITLWQ